MKVPAFDRDWMVAYKKSLGVEWRLSMDHRVEYTEALLKKEILNSNLKIQQIQCKWGYYYCVVTGKGEKSPNV